MILGDIATTVCLEETKIEQISIALSQIMLLYLSLDFFHFFYYFQINEQKEMFNMKL